MSTWPVLFENERVLFETYRPLALELTIAILCAMTLFLALHLMQAASVLPSGPRFGLIQTLLLALTFLVSFLLLKLSVTVTSHRLAIRRSFGQRFSVLYTEITALETTAFGLKIATSRHASPVRLDLIAGVPEVAQEIRKRMPE